MSIEELFADTELTSSARAAPRARTVHGRPSGKRPVPDADAVDDAASSDDVDSSDDELSEDAERPRAGVRLWDSSCVHPNGVKNWKDVPNCDAALQYNCPCGRRCMSRVACGDVVGGFGFCDVAQCCQGTSLWPRAYPTLHVVFTPALEVWAAELTSSAGVGPPGLPKVKKRLGLESLRLLAV